MEADFWDEKLGFDLWTDWLFEAVVVEEEELLKISCQSGKSGKVIAIVEEEEEVKILWERMRGENTIMRYGYVAKKGSLGAYPRVAVDKWITKLRIELSWWGLENEVGAWSWQEDGKTQYFFKFTKKERMLKERKNAQCYDEDEEIRKLWH